MNRPGPGTGYFISPSDAPGPAVLLLHSWRGLDRSAKDNANRLADAGFTVLAPDLADGTTWSDDDEALDALASADVNVLASLIQSSVGIVQAASRNPDDRIGVVGFGSGASWALWLSARLPEAVAAVVVYHGSQSIPMDQAQADYLCHWVQDDPITSDEEVANLGLSLQMARRPFRFENHADTRPGFAEPASEHYVATADAVAWRQTTEFLASTLAT